MTRYKGAFTLIELLLVVTIIALLAAVATPSLLEASVRAKVARVAADLRTLSMAIESYGVDANVPPRMAHYQFYQDPRYDLVAGIPVNGVVSKSLSTPVAYVSNPFVLDPFTASKKSVPLDERLYTYQVLGVYVTRNSQSTFWPGARDFYGEWRLASVGPDERFGHGFRNSAQLVYDPTNGALSDGNIWRGSRNSARQPTTPSLLGEH